MSWSAGRHRNHLALSQPPPVQGWVGHSLSEFSLQEKTRAAPDAFHLKEVAGLELVPLIRGEPCFSIRLERHG
jgi:hypothetical protein